MAYRVDILPAAQKQMLSLPKEAQITGAGSIDGLATNSRPLRVKKLADTGLWRVRVGQYRIVYVIDDGAQLVTIVRVARRREDTYRRL